MTDTQELTSVMIVEIGNPHQPQYVLLDTGSYELWVNPDCTALQNEQDQRFCQALGHYDASASSTAVSLGENKTLQYGIGSVTFDYYTETVGLGAGAPGELTINSCNSRDTREIQC